MDDVKPVFQIFRTSIPDGEYSRRADVVEKIHYDAQRLRADTAEAERDGAKAANNVLREELRTERLRADAAVGDANEAERKLAAAEQRIADLDSWNRRLEILLRRASNYGGLTPDWHDAVQLILAEQKEIHAALNPKPEAGSHE